MATLTGKITDVTGRAPDSISSITVKAPSVRVGGGTDLIVSSPATVDFDRSTGDVTISGLTGGLSWLHLEGEGWSDSIALSVAEGMVTLVEAVANASGIPALADYINLLIGLQNRLDEIAIDAVNDALANNSTDVIGSSGTTHANKYVKLDADGDLYIATDSIVKTSDPVNKNYVDRLAWVKRNLGRTENLDQVTETGLYTQAYSNDAKPELGYPTPWRGTLEVNVYPSGTVVQTYRSSWSGEGFVRERYAGTWLDWKDLVANLVQPVESRVESLEDSLSRIQIQPGSTLEVGDFLPDAWAKNSTSFWLSPDGTRAISPSYVGEGYVGKIGKAAGYTTQTVKKESASNKFSVTCSNDTRHVTYIVQGDDNAGWLDDMQTVDEILVGAMVNGEPSLDIELHNSSNLEWAFEIDADGTKQFVPWHGTETALKYQPTQLTDSTGTPINLSGMAVGESKQVNGVKLRMFLDAYNTSTTGVRYARINQVTTIAPDGLLQSESVWSAIRHFTIGSNYGPMTVVKMPHADTFTTATGASYDLPTTPPASTQYQTISEGRDYTSGIFTGTNGVFVATAFISPEHTWLNGYQDVETTEPLKLEYRNSGQVKLYPTVFKPGSTVPAGTTWRMGAQWRYGEADNPQQFL